jgi:hypothetical protein
MSDETETDAPWAAGLDEWHANNSNSADSDDNKKAAAEFQAHRRWHYYHTGREVGGWVSPGGMSRCNDYGKWPRMIRWA